MRNPGKLRAVKMTTVMRDIEARAAVQLGWMDAMYGRPFSPAYERAAEAWQRNYETARQSVAFARSQRRLLPGWPEGGACPEAIVRIIGEAQQAGAVMRPAAKG